MYFGSFFLSCIGAMISVGLAKLICKVCSNTRTVKNLTTWIILFDVVDSFRAISDGLSNGKNSVILLALPGLFGAIVVFILRQQRCKQGR